MASTARRHPENVAGPWYVDTACIDCDASRQCAPSVFGIASDGSSIVVKQPETVEEVQAAVRALAICPTGSIGFEGVKPSLEGVFPWELDGGVYLAGYNSSASFGANSFFVQRPEGNLLVDSPRWVPALAKRIDALGGIADILLTHKDDVAHAEDYAKRFGARVWIHEDDLHAAPFASHILHGRDKTFLRDRLVALPVPGHTRGSVVYLLEDRYLFTGDSLCWSRAKQDLWAFKRQCWYSWEAQARSLARVAELDFEWVLAGHGDRWSAPAAWMKDAVQRLVRRMQDGDRTLDADEW